MVGLNALTPLVKKRKRVGRGGNRGGTAGKGHKGQKARSGGYIRAGFEGGQMPLFRRLPKRGFTNSPFTKEFKILNLDQINEAFKSGEEVTKELLAKKGLVKFAEAKKGKKQYFLKILGKGSLTKKLSIEADAFSQSALEAIKKAGGEALITKGD